MYYIPDILAFCCLYMCGLSYGYYLKYAYVYDNLWQHWYAILGIFAVLLLAGVWMLRKRKHQQYVYDHYYLIFYGLTCFLLSGFFMISDNLEICFYFSFVGQGIVYIACYSYISLRSTSAGYRPTRIAFGNAVYFAGLSTGFAYFNEFEPISRGIVSLCLTTSLMFGVVVIELLQYLRVDDYKKSLDIVFNLLNEERLVFVHQKSVYAQFVARPDFYFVRNRQWLVVGLGLIVLLMRSCCIYSSTYMHLMWSATIGYINSSQLYAPFTLYTIGCFLGAVLLLRYKPRLIFLLFGLIEITLIAAILSIYEDDWSENCFLFLCFLYPTLGVCSSYALHWLLECTPFLYTELLMAAAYSLELCIVEAYKYERKLDDIWPALLSSSIIAIVFIVASMLVVQLYLPDSEGLIEVRNKLLGIRREQLVASHSKIWHSNSFFPHELQPHELKNVTIDKTRHFQQYPSD